MGRWSVKGFKAIKFQNIKNQIGKENEREGGGERERERDGGGKKELKELIKAFLRFLNIFQLR